MKLSLNLKYSVAVAFALISVLSLANSLSVTSKSRKLYLNKNFNSNNTNSTAVDISIPGVNALWKNSTKAIVDKSPFTVTRCDQVLQFEAETVDKDNFMNKTKKFYSMSMYSIN